jgi:hypothetical protein
MMMMIRCCCYLLTYVFDCDNYKLFRNNLFNLTSVQLNGKEATTLEDCTEHFIMMMMMVWEKNVVKVYLNIENEKIVTEIKKNLGNRKAYP